MSLLVVLAVCSNHIPVLTGVAGDFEYSPSSDSLMLVVNNSIRISDPDDPTMDSAQVCIQQNYEKGADFLTAKRSGLIKLSWNISKWGLAQVCIDFPHQWSL